MLRQLAGEREENMRRATGLHFFPHMSPLFHLTDEETEAQMEEGTMPSVIQVVLS